MKNIFAGFNLFLQRNERFVFVFLIFVFAFPALWFPIFPTLDGSSHLYNARLMHNLFFHNGGTTNTFFKLNPALMPNSSGHFLLMIFQEVLPSLWAEKFLQLIILIFLPLSFRKFVLTVHPGKPISSWLIFPLLYSFVFYLGFYNFCFAMILFFVTLSYWIRKFEILTWKNCIVLSVLFLAVFLSHLLVLAFLLSAIGIYMLVSQFRTGNPGKALADILRMAWMLSLSLLPVIFFGLPFIKSFGQNSQTIFLDYSELWMWLWRGRTLIVFNVMDEIPFTIALMFLYACLLFLVVWERFRKVRTNSDNAIRQELNTPASNATFIMALFFLALYWILPDSMSSGEFISERIQLFTLLFIAANVPAIIQHRKMSVAILFLLIFISEAGLFITNLPKIASLSQKAQVYYDLGKELKNGSCILPVNKEDAWFQVHLCNYMGAEGDRVVLQNYEATRGYFPVQWNLNFDPVQSLGISESANECWRFAAYENLSGKKIDYIVLNDEGEWSNDSCTTRLREIIAEQFVLKNKQSNLVVYTRK